MFKRNDNLVTICLTDKIIFFFLKILSKNQLGKTINNRLQQSYCITELF